MIKCRKGFTNIELTVVIGIILLLMSLVLVGFKMVGNSGKKNATKATLETARAMLNELDAARAMSRVKDLYGFVNQEPRYPYPTLAPGKVNDITRVPIVTRTVLVTPAKVTITKGTRDVMTAILAMPANQTVLRNLPPDRIWKVDDNSPGASVLLDAWGNPILFVTPGGLDGVTIRDSTGKKIVGRVTSVGNFASNQPTPPGASCFFVSAGPDADYSTGEDNLYSFGN